MPAGLLVVLLLCVCTAVYAAGPLMPSASGSGPVEAVLHAETASPSLVFVENRGQVVDAEGRLRPDIAYTSTLGGMSLFFRDDGVSYVFATVERGTSSSQTGSDLLKTSRVDMLLHGSRTDVRILPAGETREYFNFYYGHCADGITDVPGYTRLIYENIYDNIDLVFYSTEKGLKYDFIVRPGGNPGDIAMEYLGAAAPGVHDGRLRVAGALGTIEEEAPYCYQRSGASGAQAEVAGCFRIGGSAIVGFEVGDYDPQSVLVIDPGILWATYFGGNADDKALAVGTDASGNVVVSGYTQSVNLPVTVGAIQTALAANSIDLFITRKNSGGERLWTTYYGGDGTEYSGSYRAGMAVTPAGSIILTGQTSGGSFPVTIGSYGGGATDAFLLKIGAGGQRLWATFCGGSDADNGRDVAVDAAGNIYLTGVTWSLRNTFSTGQFINNKNDLSDAFLVKYSSDGAAGVAVFYGGIGSDAGNAIALDQNNDIFIAGETSSPVLLGTAGMAQSAYGGGGDAFVVKINNNSLLQVQWCTFLGGSGREQALGVAVDASGNVVGVGLTASQNFPTVAAFQSQHQGGNDIFISKLAPSGQQFLWSTYYGGSSDEEAHNVRVDFSDNVVLTGETRSSSFPLSPGTYQENLSGYSDAFLVKMTPSGQQSLATYYGGGSAECGYGLALYDGSAIIAGATQSTNLPVSIGAAQKLHAGTIDAFAARFGECSAHVDVLANGPTTICRGSSLRLDAGSGYSAYLWSNGATTRAIDVEQPGTYTVTVIGVGGCQATDSIHVNVNPLVQADRNLTLCEGDIGVLSVLASSSAGNLRYRWDPPIGLDCIDCRTPQVVTDVSRTYTVTVTDGAGCISTTTVTVTVNEAPLAEAGPGKVVCRGGSTALFASGGEKYEWSPAAGLSCLNCQGPLAVLPQDKDTMTYYVAVTGVNGCIAVDSVTLVASPPVVASAGRDTVVCVGQRIRLTGTGGVQYKWEPETDLDCPTCPQPELIVRESREYTLTVTDEYNCQSQDKILISVRPAQPLASPSPRVDFGLLGECESSTVRSAVVQNTSAEAVTINELVFTSPGLFSHVDRDGRPLAPGSRTIPPGAADTLYFRFSPQSTAPVREHVTLRGAPCNVDFTLELQGQKTLIAASTGVSSMNFGAVPVCDAPAQDTVILIRNSGSSEIAVRAFINPPFVIVSEDISATQAVRIRPGNVYSLKLRFNSAVEGVFAEELTLPYESGECTDTLQLAVVASRTAPHLSSPYPDVQFSDLLGCRTSTDTVIVLTNTGSSAVEVINADDGGAFRLGTALPLTLQPGESREIAVTFRPPTPGVFTKTLTFFGAPCGVEYAVHLTGVKHGVGFEVANNVEFPTLVLCDRSQADTALSIVNVSGADIEGRVKSVVVDGPFATTLRPGDIIGNGSVRDFGIQFMPGAAGAFSGTITVILEPCDIVKTIAVHGIARQAALTATDDSGNFGSIPLSGRTVRTLRFTNTGSADMSIDGLDGIATPFAVLSTTPPLPAVLAPGAALLVEVEYRGIAPGRDTATARIRVLEPCDTEVVAALVGETTGGHGPVLAATGLNFGRVQQWKEKTADLEIRNNGTAPATITAVSVKTGSVNFSVETSGITFPYELRPDETLRVPATFAPVVIGVTSAQVEVRTSAGDLAVGLLGEGTNHPVGSAYLAIPRTLQADVHDHNIAIPVYLDDVKDLQPIQGEQLQLVVKIRFNNTVFHPLSVTGDGTIRPLFTDGQIQLTVTFPSVPRKGEELFRLNGVALLGNEAQTEFSLHDIDWSNADREILTDGASGLLTLTGICENGGERLLEQGAFGIASITPNPTWGQVEITVSTVEYAETHLDIYDSFGKLAFRKTWVPTLNSETGNAFATQAVVVDTELPSGVYFVVLSSPVRRATARMIVSK